MLRGFGGDPECCSSPSVPVRLLRLIYASHGVGHTADWVMRQDDAGFRPVRAGSREGRIRVAERVSFLSSTGPTLAGVIDVRHGELRGWGVFAHGFTLGKDCPAASRMCKQLASEGIGMLRFDYLGLGHSEGDWGD